VRDKAPDSPGVHLPPPFIFVAAVGGGIMLHRAVPLPLLPASLRAAAVAAGWLLLAGGLVVSIQAILSFRRARTSVMPNRPARRLVTHGPYRFSRNPMYMSLTMQGLGLSFLVNTLWSVLFLFPGLVALYFLVVRSEERYLGKTFGEEYAAYRSRVRRWL